MNTLMNMDRVNTVTCKHLNPIIHTGSTMEAFSNPGYSKNFAKYLIRKNWLKD